MSYPNRDGEKWERWTMPEPQIPGQRSRTPVHGWSALEANHGSTDPVPDTGAPMHGTFAAAGSYGSQYPAPAHRTTYDDESAAAFWAFPEPEFGTEMTSPGTYGYRDGPPELPQRPSDRSTGTSQGGDYQQESDDDRRSLDSYATAQMDSTVRLL